VRGDESKVAEDESRRSLGFRVLDDVWPRNEVDALDPDEALAFAYAALRPAREADTPTK
jgi:hypothetical protein